MNTLAEKLGPALEDISVRQDSKYKVLRLSEIKQGDNSRESINTEDLSGLMQSIKEIGLLQPIGVYKNGGGYYKVAYGNRRFIAIKKLGWSEIPVLIHEQGKTARQNIELKNLAENVQRSNISLREVGRYIKLLSKQGFQLKEIAIKLGSATSFVESAKRSFEEIPSKFHESIDVRPQASNNKGVTPAGKISMTVANKILNARRTYDLNREQTCRLLEMAKKESFSADTVRQYAKYIKEDRKTLPEKMKQINVSVVITEKHYDQLVKKYIDNGPFRSMTALFLSILKGEKAVRVEVKGHHGAIK